MSSYMIMLLVRLLQLLHAQACPMLEYLGGLSSWGRVEKEELEMMQMEVKARNLNLTLQ